MTDPQSGTEWRPRRRTWPMLLAVLGTVTLLAAACPAEEEEAEGPVDVPEEAVQIGWIAWDEAIAVTNLWEYLLEEEGYNVELEGPLDAGLLYSGLAEADIDMFLDSWLPVTHEDYLEQHGDDMEDLGVWYDDATLENTVPEYVEEVDSLDELADNGELFGERIVGIEPGAGLTRLTREEVLPTYGLEDWELVEGSTPGMLAELDRAVEAEEPIVVTLWHPHWAYEAYDLKDLEDPENALGEAEQIHAQARTGFSDDFPDVARWMDNFEMTGEELNSLTFLVIEEYEEGEEREAVLEWLEDPEHQELVDSWID